jgi:Fe-S cluster biogenesis protein NfuA/nitrite reductase/ring-hydroxylating ferredoxin subunit
MSATEHSDTATPGDVADDLIGHVQDLQDRLDELGDETARELAEELVSAVVSMYGAGLERIVDALMAGEEPVQRAAAALAEDPLVAALLMIHDLHPVPLAERVAEALERVRPYMESHGGNVELISLESGVARLRLQGSCSDCSASSVTLELAIKQALEELAPDLEALEVEGMAGEPEPALGGFALPMVHSQPAQDGKPGDGLLTLPMAGGAGAAGGAGGDAGAPPAWFELDGVARLGVSRLHSAQVAGVDLLVANVGGTLLAYRDVCADCGAPLHGGDLQEGALTCPACARTYFLPRAGRSMDDERLQLQPVPLLREDGQVLVALAP